MAERELVIERGRKLEVLRERELIQLERGIRHQEYIAISATPQGGLTTFLQQAQDHLESAPDLIDWVPIQLDVTEWDDNLFVFIALELADHLVGRIKNKSSRIRRFNRFEKKGLDPLFKSAFGKSDGKAVFFIDDFHRLTVEKQRQFVSFIRQLHTYRPQSPYLQRMLFVIGGVLIWQRIDPDRTSPFSNAAFKVTLQDFEPDETIALVNQKFRRQGCRISPTCGEYIHEITRGHPYFTHTLCDMILRQGPHEVTFKEIDRTVSDLIHVGDGHLHGLRQTICESDPEDMEPLVRILQGEVVRQSTLSPDFRLDHLILLGICSTDAHHRVEIRNSIYSRFLRSDSKVQEHLLDGATLPPEELLSFPTVAANKEVYCRINQLENDLRNFVVSHLYQKHQDRWVEEGLAGITSDMPVKINNRSERDLAVVLPERKRIESQDFSLPHTEDALISYATLKELQLVIIKHWKHLFKKLIGSQDRFKVYLTTLNRIRNKLAHNRNTTDEDLRKLREIQESFQSWLGRV